MKARELAKTRIVYSATVFAELVVWELEHAVPGVRHRFKYRLALVCDGSCVIRYDNETGKGDHRHIGDREFPYEFASVDKLLLDFARDIERWINENRYP
jgi:hypothetical protein